MRVPSTGAERAFGKSEKTLTRSQSLSSLRRSEEQIHPRYLPGPFKFSRGQLPVRDTHDPHPQHPARTPAVTLCPTPADSGFSPVHTGRSPMAPSRRWPTLLHPSASLASLCVCWHHPRCRGGEATVPVHSSENSRSEPRPVRQALPRPLARAACTC